MKAPRSRRAHAFLFAVVIFSAICRGLAATPEKLIVYVNLSRETNMVLATAQPANIRMISTLTNETVFYTLDGSQPTPASLIYSEPFLLASNAVIRAVVFDPAFNSFESPPVRVTFLGTGPLELNTIGSGEIRVTPQKDTYSLDEEVQLLAVPDPYFTFTGWSDGVSTSARTISISASNHFTASFTNVVALEEQFYLESEHRLSEGWAFEPGAGILAIGEDLLLAGSSFDDYRAIRVTPSGSVVWDKSMGSKGLDRARHLLQHRDGSLLISGYSGDPGPYQGFGPEIPRTAPYFGSTDYWVINLDSNGNRIWDRAFGGTWQEVEPMIIPAHEGGYLLSGDSYSPAGGNKTDPNPGFWTVRLDAHGDPLSDQVIPSPFPDSVFTRLFRTPRGYLLSGTESDNNYGQFRASVLVAWDQLEQPLWQKRYTINEVQDAIQARDGSHYLLSFHRWVPWNSSVTKLNPSGDLQWTTELPLTGLLDLHLDDANGIYAIGTAFPPFSGETPALRLLHFDSSGAKVADSFHPVEGATPSIPALKPLTSIKLNRNLFAVAGHRAGRYLWLTRVGRYLLPVGTPRIQVNGAASLSHDFTNRVSVPIVITSSRSDAEIFYSLDGSTNTAAAQRYTGPIQLDRSANLRAFAQVGRFNTPWTPAVEVRMMPVLTLTSTPGGSVKTTPSGTNFPPNTFVHLSASPSNGWHFVRWEGSVSGSAPEIDLLMDGHKTVRAVFGSTLTLSTNGSGRILPIPNLPLYPAGTTITLMGIPENGHYFALWGGSVEGAANSHKMLFQEPRQVSALFLPVPSGQAALTVLVNGRGRVTSDPAGKLIPLGQSVTLRATPESGSSFLGWSGDVTTNSNPFALTVDRNLVLYANFTGGDPGLFGGAPFINSVQWLPPGLLQLEVVTTAAAQLRLETSTNLLDWQPMGGPTNTTRFELNISGTEPYRFYRLSQ